jgi:hypothetical protein
MDVSSEDVERLLRTARPAPPPDFVRELEARLPHARPARARRRPRALLAATGLAGALAVTTLLIAVTTGLPVGSHEQTPAQAKDGCRTIVVERMQRQATIRRGRDGELHVRYHQVPVPQRVTRCR